MKQNTIVALLQAYTRLQQIAAELYEAAEAALENDDFDDASLLATRADKLYEEAENLDILISEMEGE
jgi:phage shock protein A